MKARKKAHTAQKQRNKSMKKARKLNDEDYIECPDCGFQENLTTSRLMVRTIFAQTVERR